MMKAQAKTTVIDKSSLREEFLAKRISVSPVVAQHYAAEISSKILNNFDFEGKVVAGYWPVKGEVDIRPILMHLSNRGSICALPVVSTENQPLSFRSWTSKTDMVDGVLGIPVPDISSPDVKLVTPDILLVPFVAYDRRGYRLGYGGGYYDRTIAHLRSKGKIETIGVGFTVQKMQDLLPIDEHDVALDCVVTERMIDRF